MITVYQDLFMLLLLANETKQVLLGVCEHAWWMKHEGKGFWTIIRIEYEYSIVALRYPKPC